MTELLTGRIGLACRKIKGEKEIMKVGRIKMRCFKDVKKNMTKGRPQKL
jgi:hypothetical protein